MNRNSRLCILVIAALCFSFMYLSQTFIGLIANPYFIQTNTINRNITNWRWPQLLPSYFNASAASHSNCSRVQNEAKKRIDKYCESKSLNWTKVINFEFCLMNTIFKSYFNQPQKMEILFDFIS